MQENQGVPANVGRRCSCAEIAGEDPRCILHGAGTMWAKENPDLCIVSERLQLLGEALKPFADALDEWGDDPQTADRTTVWEHPLGMCISVGDFRRAAIAIEARSGETENTGSVAKP